jgi:5-methylcytosine-specific restriction endonuclease McrA
MKDLKVLVLNADFIPLNLVPISTVDWRKAFKLIFEDLAVPIQFYDGEFAHTINNKYPVPSVILLKDMKKVKKHAKWSKYNIKLRDDFCCQYCGKRFSARALTVDHVKPRSQGHGHSWTNSVAACKPCNQEKKDHTHMQPRRAPYRPDYLELATKLLKEKEVKHPHWKQYVNYLTPKK